MRRARVILAPIVERQIDAQVLYIAQDSVDNALAWEDRLRAAVMKIGDAPRGYAVDEAASERSGFEVRKMVFERT